MFEILLERKLVRVRGKDAGNFLQRLATCDVESDFYGMILSPQGRFMFEFFIFKDNDSYLLDVDCDHVEHLIQYLGTYKLRSAVEFIVEPDFKVAYSHTAVGSSAKKDPRSSMGYRSIVDQSVGHLAEQFTYLTDKYAYSVPCGRDMNQDKSFPQEYGIDLLGGINYKKGCYVGQEVVARTKYLGQVRKRIYKIESEHDLSHCIKNDAFDANGARGLFCSSFKNIGIALVRDEGEDLSNIICNLGGMNVLIHLASWYNG